MSGYIERDKIGLTNFEILLCNGSYKEALVMLLKKIESMPAADVRPVVRGIWIKHRFSENMFGFECNVCHTTWDTLTDFCPFCGAAMREVI